MIEYDELRIRAWRVGRDHRYLVFANGPATAACAIVVLRQEPQLYRDVLTEILEEHFGRRPVDLDDNGPQREALSARLATLGRDLFKTFFPRALRDCLDESFRSAGEAQRRLRLRLDVPPELAPIPFEVLCSDAADPVGHKGLVRNPDLSVVRSAKGNPHTPLRRPKPEDKHDVVRILVVVSPAHGQLILPSGATVELCELDLDHELDRIEDAVPKVLNNVFGCFEWLGGPRSEKRATREEVGRFFQNRKEPCAAIFIGHGLYDAQERRTRIVLERADGGPDPVDATILAGYISEATALRFVALNLCVGAATAPGEPFSGLAQALIANGIPAVAAMQTDVSDVSSARFGPTLLGGICRNQTVDEAVAKARRDMAVPPDGHSGDLLELGGPVLFVHEDYGGGWLFKVNLQEPDLPDPLQESQRALDRVRDPRARPRPRKVIAQEYAHALRLLRWDREWQKVADTAAARTGQEGEPQFARWQREAQIEIQLQTSPQHPVCQALCQDRSTERPSETREWLEQLDQQTTDLSDRLPKEILDCLKTEIDRRRQACSEIEAAQRALDRRDWDGAIDHSKRALELYREERPRQIQLAAESYKEGDAAWAAERWEDASRCFSGVLERLPDDSRARHRKAYAEGRSAEEQSAADPTQWGHASECYHRARREADASERRRYALGRAAEAAGEWPRALAAYKRLPAGCRDVARRQTYTRARIDEGQSHWEAAGVQYDTLRRFEDAASRAAYVRLRRAIDERLWPDALQLSGPLQDFDDVQAWRDFACDKLWHEALEHEAEARWDEAGTCLTPLPDAYHDAHRRRAYARARAAEARNDWPGACEAYASPGLVGYDDAVLRGRYAEARRAEALAVSTNENWAAVVAALDSLPDTYRDVRERKLCATAFEAAEREDWRAVTDRFFDLPDTFADGRVGHLRGYARARQLERAMTDSAPALSWSAVDEALLDVPDEYRSGEVGRLRRYARARAAEHLDWSAASAAYLQLGDPDFRDVRARHAYARGRAAEARSDWPAAWRAYEQIHETFQDAGKRGTYALGRACEAEGEWRGAWIAYEALPVDHVERAARSAYAQANVHMGGEAWREAVDALLPLDDTYRDAGVMRHYANGRAAESGSHWATAVAEFGQCLVYRDSRTRHGYALGRRFEDNGEWSRAIELYEGVEQEIPEAVVRRHRLTRLLEALPWIDGLATAILVADPLSARDGVIPYAAISAAGVTPGSPVQEVKEASFSLMERGVMTGDARLAWDQLRNLQGRLRIDAFMYRLTQPEGLRQVQLRFVADEDAGADPLTTVCSEIPEDGPLFMLLAGRREAAIAQWNRRHDQTPTESAVAHALAIAFYWRARDLEAAGAYEQCEASWDRAIVYWTLVLSDDAYWDAWRRDRASQYRDVVTSSNSAQLRSELGQRLLRTLASEAERCASDRRPERARRYLQMSSALEVELEGARALKEAGGLPIQGLEHTLVCGPMYVALAGHGQRLGRLVARLEQEAEKRDEDADLPTMFDALARVLDQVEQPSGVTAELMYRLRTSFSELGQAVILLDRHQPEQALEALPREHLRRFSELPADCGGPPMPDDESHVTTCAVCARFTVRNPSYLYLPNRGTRLVQDAVELAIRANLDRAQTALLLGRTPVALESWRAAVDIAQYTGAQVRTKKAVVQIGLGRADALANERGARRGELLTEALTLIEAVREIVGRAGQTELTAKASEILTQRGVWHGYGCHEFEEPNLDKAAEDLRQSLALNPDSLHARNNFARALVFSAVNTSHYGDTSQALAMMVECLQVLHEGLRRTAGHRQLLEILREALREMEEWFFHDLTTEELAKRIRAGGQPGAVTETAQQAAAAARRKLEAGDVAGAVASLIEAARKDPTDDGIRQELIGALEQRAGRR